MGNIMGSYFSWSSKPLDATLATQQKEKEHSLCKSQYDPISLLAIRDISTLSQDELEAEFNQLCKNSTDILRRLADNPCEQLSRRVAECLESSTVGIANCMGVMGKYQSCVSGQVSKRLAENLTAKKPDTERPGLKHVNNVTGLGDNKGAR